jgi:hypothetical protein
MAGCSGTSLFRPDPEKGWMLFDVTTLRDYYFDRTSITRLSDYTVKVAVATVAKGPEGRDWEVNERMKRGLSFAGYEKYQFSEDMYAIDCQEKRFQLLSGVDYDGEGKTLGSYTKAEPIWEPIPRGSVLETLAAYKSVCP